MAAVNNGAYGTPIASGVDPRKAPRDALGNVQGGLAPGSPGQGPASALGNIRGGLAPGTGATDPYAAMRNVAGGMASGSPAGSNPLANMAGGPVHPAIAAAIGASPTAQTSVQTGAGNPLSNMAGGLAPGSGGGGGGGGGVPPSPYSGQQQGVPPSPYSGQQQGGSPAGYHPGGANGAPMGPPKLGGMAGGLAPGTVTTTNGMVDNWLRDPTHVDGQPDKYNPSPAAATVLGKNTTYDVTGQRAATTAISPDAYARQSQLANMLQGAAAGQGPSGAGMAAAAQRDASLTQAAALLSGRRGQSAGVGIRAAGNQAVAGNQLASQNEAIGRANEISGARSQLAGVLGQQANENVSQAQLDQQVNLANAANAQQASLANQGVQSNIALAEMQERARQEQMAYGNLNPGKGSDSGILGPVLGLGGAVIGGIYGGPAGAVAGYTVGNAAGSGLSAAADGKYVSGPTVALIGEAGPEVVVPLTPGSQHRGMQVSALRSIARALHEGRFDQGHGGHGVPAMADGGYVGVGAPPLAVPQAPQMPYGYGYQPPVQLMGIGQRVVPNFNVDSNIRQARIQASIQALVNAYISHLYGKQAAEDKAAKAVKADEESRPLGMRFPHGQGSGPVTSPDDVPSGDGGGYWTRDLPGPLSDAASDVPAMRDGGYVGGREPSSPLRVIALAIRRPGRR